MIGDSFGANDDNDKSKTFCLSIKDDDGETVVTRHHSYAVCWPTLLEDFIALMTAAGYVGVKERIALCDEGFLAAWDGKTFSDYGLNTEDDWK